MDTARLCDQTASQLKRCHGKSTTLFDEKDLLSRELAHFDMAVSHQHRPETSHHRLDKNVQCFRAASHPIHTLRRIPHTAALEWTGNVARKDRRDSLAVISRTHYEKSRHRCSGRHSSRHHILQQRHPENLLRIEHKICEDSWPGHHPLQRTCRHTTEGATASRTDQWH